MDTRRDAGRPQEIFFPPPPMVGTAPHWQVSGPVLDQNLELLPLLVPAENLSGRLRTAPNSYAQLLTASHYYLALSTRTCFMKPPA